MTTRQAMRFRVEGRVQGVGFRAFTHRTARGLGLSGWVRNTPDGAVEGLAEGPPEALDGLLQALREGPPAGRVRALSTEAVAATGEAGFQVRR